ncbi:MAG: pyridoxamine 5'-phosphate oxidase family protein [Bacteroidales bacterium]|nr:pyridoxamine 5'-phosphate oxidase family protein [Bacteroidales bacterium]
MKTVWVTEKEEIEEIIRSCEVCVVGMVDEEGNPYTLPMNFGYDDSTIYLHSGPAEGKKLECLRHNNRICICFYQNKGLTYVNQEVACSYSMKSESVIAFCEVSFPESLEEKEKALNVLMRNYTSSGFKYSVPALKNVKIWKADIKRITGKKKGVTPA